MEEDASGYWRTLGKGYWRLKEEALDRSAWGGGLALQEDTDLS